MIVDLTKTELEIIVRLLFSALPPELQQLLEKLNTAAQEANKPPKDD